MYDDDQLFEDSLKLLGNQSLFSKKYYILHI